MVARSSEPGANISALAREIGISPSQLFGWRAAPPKTDEVERAGKDEEASLGRLQAHHSRTIEIDVNGMTVRAGATVCEDHLRRVLRAVRSA
ncbi:MAG: IS66 family insertion sequence element accessory protein TnpB [Mesorhizobium sp.]|nr:MAG: IS66 family insertion sequence element accessory protein TnpB [Mesorhizobium sp.]